MHLISLHRLALVQKTISRRLNLSLNMKSKNKGKYYAGTSGLVLPVKNKSFFPPEFQNQSRLAYYGSLFNSIEINSSFYKVPRLITMQKWADNVPPDFQFTFKLWKVITHVKDLAFDTKDVQLFMDNIDISNKRKGCLLLQFPASLKFSAFKKLQQLISALQSNDKRKNWKISLEFRDKSWYRDEVFQFIEANKCVMVFHDKTGSEAPTNDTQSDCVYLRFHGPEGDYRGSYEDHFLHEYASYIKEWLSAGKDVYVYFNNTMGEAMKNLLTLNKYVLES